MDVAHEQVYQFERFTLDMTRRVLRTPECEIALRAKSFDVLCCLVAHAGRLVAKDAIIRTVWPGVTVTDESLARCVSDIRLALDDRQQRIVKTISGRGYLLAVPVAQPASRNVSAAEKMHADTVVRDPASSAARQDVRFCTTPDGVRIAHATVGHGPPLVRAAHWLNHLEYDWDSPLFGPILHRLARGRQFLRYDARGNGLSDWEVDDLSFEGFVRDLETVVDAAGLKRFALIGMSQGCPISIAYATRHPERVSHLVLYGGYARGRRKRAAPGELEHIDAMVTVMRQGWRQENPAFRQLWTSMFLPGGSAEQMQSFNELQRITTSPENAVRMRQAMDEIDVADLLPQVKAPTLVIHCRDDAVSPFEEGRCIAATIPGARFVALEGRNHCPLEAEPAWSRIFEAIDGFLKPQSANLQLVAKR